MSKCLDGSLPLTIDFMHLFHFHRQSTSYKSRYDWQGGDSIESGPRKSRKGMEIKSIGEQSDDIEYELERRFS